jgi:signal transduction histidine kinase/DNA-binding response OmpR family regulator/CHASE3 domain sensor protein
MPKKFLRELQIGFGVSLLLLVASSTASYMSIRNQIHNSVMVDHSRRVIARANQILIDLQNAETGQRGFLLTGRDEFLEPYSKSVQSLPVALDRAKELVTDNPAQASVMDSISNLVQSRLGKLTDLVEVKRQNKTVTVQNLQEGKKYMDSCRSLIAKFVAREEQILDQRSFRLNSSSTYTSIFVVLAAITSLIVAVISYIRLKKDLAKREKLQRELKAKEEEIRKRLKVTQQVAAQIAAGNYKLKLNDAQQDELGSVSISLNEMAGALEKSFEKLSTNEWRQTGLANLAEILMGNKKIDELASATLDQLIEYGNCVNGAFYLVDGSTLLLKAAYGLEDRMHLSISPGQGAVGQVFKNGKERLFENMNDEHCIVSFTSGQFKINYILLLPIFEDRQCIGVLELGSFQPFTEDQLPYYREAARHVGIAIGASKARLKVQNLLEETQTQAEELQSQHAELESLNANLENHTQRLQLSEEELRVQQEELLTSNRELAERSALLEEKNMLIADRNLEIQKKAQELELSTRYKSEFLANMSHELRTPLNSILLLSRLMADNPENNLTGQQVESAQIIQSSGKSLLTLIDEILDLSKIESGKMELDYQDVQLAAVEQSLKDMFLPIIKDKGLSFFIQHDENLPATVETDRHRLEQILRNLLSNATKFTRTGSITLTVKKAPQEPDGIIFEVKDTGIGIPNDKQQLIFEAFQQADGSTRRKFGGTGLGLSISRELARLLGGEIQLTSILKQGSTFSLSIPLKKITKEPIPLAAEINNLIEENITDVIELQPAPSYVLSSVPDEIEDDRNNIQLEDRIILIVEDDTNFARALLQYARQHHYKGIVIVRGDMAAKVAAECLPTAILLDIQLPIMDGWQVMDEIKKNPKTRHIPVHIMSSFQVKKESLLNGAIDFINKPLALEEMDQIFRKIEEALDRGPRKVLIVEENSKHAQALSFFLSSFDIQSEIKTDVQSSIEALCADRADCIILDMGLPDKMGYETLEAIKTNTGLENLPIIIFTGKSLSPAEEFKVKQYADAIVVKTANSYQRILDEVGLFLHLVETGKNDKTARKNKLGDLTDVLQNKKVLIADDDIRNIYSLTQALEKHQMIVVSATDGKEAILRMEEHTDIAIVLMDMMMPEMDGYQSIQVIRQNEHYKAVPIIAVTAKTMLGDREKCIEAGASDYISKPVDTDQLLSLLRVWLY